MLKNQNYRTLHHFQTDAEQRNRKARRDQSNDEHFGDWKEDHSWLRRQKQMQGKWLVYTMKLWGNNDIWVTSYTWDLH